MAQILDLTNETLIEITSYLSSNDHLRLSLCSNRFKAISQLLLYKKISLSRRSIPLLVRSLYNQPSLGLLIEAVHLNDMVNDNYPANTKLVLDDIEDNNLAQLPQPLGGLEKLRADLSSHQGGAWLALLLPRLGSLTQLEWHFRHSPEHVINLLRAAASEEWKHSRFVKLQAIRFWMEKEVLLDVNPVLQLPALRTLDVENLLFLPCETTDLETCGLLNLNVKHLKDPIMSPRVALALLRACGNLNRCTLFLAGENGAGYWYHGNCVVKVFNALRRSRKSLQELELNLPTEFSPRTLGKHLARYQCLIKLQLPAVMALTPDHQSLLHQLPPSLRVLILIVEFTKPLFKRNLHSALLHYTESEKISPSLAGLTILWPPRGRRDRYQNLAVACSKRDILFASKAVDRRGLK